MLQLPELGGIAAGAVLAGIIELGKALGLWNERHAGLIIVVFCAVWAGIAAVVGVFPQSEPWVVMLVRIIFLFLGPAVGAKAGYEAAVKPVTQKRWNAEK